jgi:hypothetical protein
MVVAFGPNGGSWLLSQFLDSLGTRILEQNITKKRRIDLSKNLVLLLMTTRAFSISCDCSSSNTSVRRCIHPSLTNRINPPKYRVNTNSMICLILIPFLASRALAFATPRVVARDSSVVVTSLEKNVTSTSGSGNVAAAGNLTPFGDVGIGTYSTCVLCACD